MVRRLIFGTVLAVAVMACGAEPEPIGGLTPVGDIPKFEFPIELWDQGVEGSTVLLIHVNEGGQVDSVMVHESSGYEAFDQAAVDGARELRFEPAVQGGRVVPTWARLPIRFSRDSAGIQSPIVADPR
ncbi:MAG TPA: energy transducer TonB [Longimicrobiales bacterium]|nr:energy transducer TonB [Longimicrobiales bacterium]